MFNVCIRLGGKVEVFVKKTLKLGFLLKNVVANVSTLQQSANILYIWI